MPEYRLYLLNPHSGHIDGVEEFHSGDDVEAILLVQGRQRAVPVELWCGGRKVIHVDAPPEGAVRSASGRAPRRPDRVERPRRAPPAPAAESGQELAAPETAPEHKTTA